MSTGLDNAEIFLSGITPSTSSTSVGRQSWSKRGVVESPGSEDINFFFRALVASTLKIPCSSMKLSARRSSIINPFSSFLNHLSSGTSKPCLGRRRSLLKKLSESFLNDALSDTIADLLIKRQSEGKLCNSVIQERHTDL